MLLAGADWGVTTEGGMLRTSLNPANVRVQLSKFVFSLSMKTYSLFVKDTADYVTEKLFSGHMLGLT